MNSVLKMWKRYDRRIIISNGKIKSGEKTVQKRYFAGPEVMHSIFAEKRNEIFGIKNYLFHYFGL